MAALAANAQAPRVQRTTEGVRAEAGSIDAMDGLRGISVAWIVLFHYAVLDAAVPDAVARFLNHAPGIAQFVAQGPWAVDLFFLMSGFLLTLPWLVRARDARPPPDMRRFYERRIARIVPAYYVQLALLFALVMPLLHGLTYWRADLYVYAANALAHALFVHNLSPLTSASLGVNGALWTLAIEAQFYLLLPWLAPLFVRAPWRSLALAAAVSAAWAAGARHGFDALVRWHIEIGRHWGWDEEAIRRLLAIQFPAYVAHFALGAMLARAWLARDAMPRWLAPAILGGSLAWLAAAAAGARPFGDFTWMGSVAAIGGVMLAAAVSTGAFTRAVLSRGPVAFMGRISYSAYLWHLPLLLLLQASGVVTARFALYLASVVAVGWISWRCLERPFMQGRGRASAGPPPAP